MKERFFSASALILARALVAETKEYHDSLLCHGIAGQQARRITCVRGLNTNVQELGMYFFR